MGEADRLLIVIFLHACSIENMRHWKYVPRYVLYCQCITQYCFPLCFPLSPFLLSSRPLRLTTPFTTRSEYIPSTFRVRSKYVPSTFLHALYFQFLCYAQLSLAQPTCLLSLCSTFPSSKACVVNQSFKYWK